QVMGAYGISEEYDAERLYRDARPFTYLDGTTEIHKLIIGREVLGMGAFV
ncbi:MAG TPA: acyl-CoA dehydrogenase, partial [Gammaproteobacteria bacterium]|nr:acyl-CoA dehydrogenase [Gammaproteobacteria bacterium]